MISGFLDRRVSVAPMMDWTDRHCRYFLRGFAPDLLLYTEMVTASAILRGDVYSRHDIHVDAGRGQRFGQHPLDARFGGRVQDASQIKDMAVRDGRQFLCRCGKGPYGKAKAENSRDRQTQDHRESSSFTVLAITMTSSWQQSNVPTVTRIASRPSTRVCVR